MAELDSGIVFSNRNNFSWTTRKSTVRHEKRLVDALTKVLDSSFTFSDDTILDKIYLHLCEKEGNFNLNIVLPWLSNVLREWDKLKKNIKSFALKMAGVVADCPNGFKKMVESGLLEKLCMAVGSCHDEMETPVILGLVKMLSGLVKSIEGAKWFLDSGLWELILVIHNSSESIYVARETNQLIIALVTVIENVEPELCWRIIDSLLAPLNVTKSADPPLSRREMLMSAQIFVNTSIGGCESFGDLMPKCGDYQNVASESSKDSVNSNKKILPTIQLLCSLIDGLLERNCSAYDVNIIFKNYNLYKWCWEQLSCENYDSKLIGWLSSLILYLIYSTMPRTEDKKVTEGDLLDTLKGFLFLIQALTSKRKYLAVNNICVLSQKLADKLISTPVYLCKEDGVTYNFRAQILFLHALPIFIFLKLARITHADVADKFADKLFTLTSITVKRVCYHYRDTIRVCPECCNTEELLRSSVQTLTGILKYLHKDQVIVVFQSLMHLLREFVPDEYAYLNKVTPLETFDLVNKYPKLLMDILDGIEITIKNYNITWSESLETSCVLVLLMSLSCISELTTPLSTKLLHLIHLAISNFIPPNLALLVENFKNSSLELLGPLLLRKLNDIHWEVRDSALEVLQTLSFLSALKFPAFQNLLLELNFPSIIIGMFECDEESYVRSSAIVCLQKMVQVKRLWEEAMADKKLLEKMLECLKKEPEGIVRKEAVNLITAIYLSHEICENLMEGVYQQVTALSACDLHWEVKVCTLLFWDAVIDQETANQGMIDGVFPAVTFSKASRKIVALTPAEIKKRLKLVLDNLEKYGCLQALWITLNDTSDLEVARKSVTIITKLLKLLQQYGVVEETCGRATVLPEPSSEIDGNRLFKKFDENMNSQKDEDSVINKETGAEGYHHPDSNQFTVAAEEVIKSIVDSQDVELLSSVYHMDKTGGESTKQASEIVVSSNSFITVNEFIEKVTSLNLESVIRVRTEWLMASDDLDSLIDDILAVNINIRPNINAKDCY